MKAVKWEIHWGRGNSYPTTVLFFSLHPMEAVSPVPFHHPPSLAAEERGQQPCGSGLRPHPAPALCLWGCEWMEPCLPPACDSRAVPPWKDSQGEWKLISEWEDNSSDLCTIRLASAVSAQNQRLSWNFSARQGAAENVNWISGWAVGGSHSAWPWKKGRHGLLPLHPGQERSWPLRAQLCPLASSAATELLQSHAAASLQCMLLSLPCATCSELPGRLGVGELSS